MPQTIKKTVYSFKELVALAKERKIKQEVVERVRSKLADWQTSGEWYEYTKDLWYDALDQIGFEDADISFSGFASQGDGASFTADLNIDKLIFFLTTDIEAKACIEPTPRTGEKEDFLPYVLTKITRGLDERFKRLRKVRHLLSGHVERTTSRYVHENTCRVVLEFDASEKAKLRPLVDEFEKDVEQLRYSLCKAIYRALEEDYFSQTEEEALIEFDEANEWKWDASGRHES